MDGKIPYETTYTVVKIMEEMGIETVIHTDPIVINDERLNLHREMVKNIIAEVNPDLGMHDFRMTDGENRINLIFDLEVPYELTDLQKKDVISVISKKIKEENEKYFAVIKADYKPSFELNKTKMWQYFTKKISPFRWLKRPVVL